MRGTLQVAGGNEQSARKYYRDVVAPQMKFETTETIESSSIKNLLAYFGYADINARDLHQLSSDQLMALGADGDILATAFFAPKISRVETPPPASPAAFGWRKLVRFKAKAGSAADANGMELLYFLQNIFEKSPTGNPLDADKNVSLFNQAIATRKVGSGPYSQSKRALYFFAYGPLVKCDEAMARQRSCEGSSVPIKVGGQFQDDGAIGFKLEGDLRRPQPGDRGGGQGLLLRAALLRGLSRQVDRERQGQLSRHRPLVRPREAELRARRRQVQPGGFHRLEPARGLEPAASRHPL